MEDTREPWSALYRKHPLPFQPEAPVLKPSPAALPFSGFPFSHEPNSHLSGARPHCTTFHIPIFSSSCHSPPTPSCSKSSLIHPLQPQTLAAGARQLSRGPASHSTLLREVFPAPQRPVLPATIIQGSSPH